MRPFHPVWQRRAERGLLRAVLVYGAVLALGAVVLGPWLVEAQVAGTVNIGRWFGSTAPTVGQKTMANSIPVVLPSDQTVATTQVGLTAIATGQQAVTATAVVLPTNTAKRVCLKVLITGTQDVAFGPSTVTTANGQILSPGDAWCGSLDNSNRIFVIAAGTGSTVAFDVLN